MASLYKKVISGKPYWYLREMGWVDGKPKMVSERYVGTAADIEALLDAREEQMLPGRTRHLDFGAVAAAWGLARMNDKRALPALRRLAQRGTPEMRGLAVLGLGLQKDRASRD